MRSFNSTLALALGWLLVLSNLSVRGQQKRETANRHNQSATLRQIAALVASSQFEKAERELDLLLRDSPNDAQALNFLGVVRAKQNRTADAEALFKQSIAAFPRLAAAHINLGLLYSSSSRSEEAIEQFEEALRIKPRHKETASFLVSELRRDAAKILPSGDNEKALARLLRAKTLAPSDPDVLFEFAVVGLRLSLNDDATGALRQALQKRPDEPQFIYALARARLNAGDLTESELLFRRYVDLRPDDASAHYGFGLVLSILQRKAEAASEFHRSIDLQPEQTESPYQLGLLAFADGKTDEAAEWFTKTLARHKDHVGALIGIGQVQFDRKQYSEARKTLERVIYLEPNSGKAHYVLGLTYARLGSNDAAEEHLKIAASLERDQKNKGRTVLRLVNQ